MLARYVRFQLVHKLAIGVYYFAAAAAFKVKMLVAFVSFIYVSVKYLFAVFAARAQNFTVFAKL